MKTIVFSVTSIVDYYLSHLYGIQNHKPEQESTMLSRLVTRVLGDHYITCPVNLFANLLLGHEANVNQYYWTYKGNPRTSAFWNTFSHAWCGEWMGACHSFEMFAIFGAPFLEPNAFNTEDHIVSMKAMQMIAYFAYNRFKTKTISLFFNFVSYFYRTLFWPQFSSSSDIKATRLYYIIDSAVDQFRFGTDLKLDVCDKVWRDYLL